MGKSSIEWTDRTWNPLAGCTRVSRGCDNCYAAIMARRLEAMALQDMSNGKNPGRKMKYIGTTNKLASGRIVFNGTINLDPQGLSEPATWKKPSMVFVNSMSDLFHKDVPDAFIGRVWSKMLEFPQHTFQVLTKRPERMADVVTRLVEEGYRKGFREPSNIWLGTSVENQDTADERIPELLKVPARVRFLSMEPLLGPVDLRLDLMEYGPDGEAPIFWHAKDCSNYCDYACGGEEYPGGIDWVIVGGESGHNARPMHPQWVRSLLDQCQRVGVPFFFKQHGEYEPVTPLYGGRDDSATDGRGELVSVSSSGHIYGDSDGQPADPRTWLMERVGKHKAGRLLDGREWNEMPLAREERCVP